jgi:peptidoglycan/LPS O-acetylase OafA/YrhL
VGSADFFKYLFYAQNLIRQNTQMDYFSVAWSLSVEEWFYIVFPALLLASTAVIGQNNTKSILAISVAFVSVVALARVFFGDFGNWGDAVRPVGIWILVVCHRASGDSQATALLAFWAIVVIADRSSLLAKHLFPWLAALFGSSCILLALKLEHAVAARRWLSKIGLFVGKISY